MLHLNFSNFLNLIISTSAIINLIRKCYSIFKNLSVLRVQKYILF
jgi:hypothetical protein